MAEPRLAAAAAAQLHDRGARRALRIRRAGSRGARALPDGPGLRHAARDPGGAPVTRTSPPSTTCLFLPALREKIAAPTALANKMTRKFRNLTLASDTAVTRAEGGFDKFLDVSSNGRMPLKVAGLD